MEKTVARDQNSMIRYDARSGQAMLIAVLSLGGAILGATTVAGLLMLYQIRATTDTANSAKAIFAADAGTEWALFNYYCGINSSSSQCSNNLLAMPTFSGSGASTTVNCYDNYGATGDAIPCNATSTVVAISSGIANGSERAFFIGLSGAAATTYP
jgi:hypothetical protein